MTENEQILKEKYFKYWLSNDNLTSSDACNWWLSEIKERDKRLVEEIENSKTTEEDCFDEDDGLRDVWQEIRNEAFNHGLTKAQEIIKKFGV